MRKSESKDQLGYRPVGQMPQNEDSCEDRLHDDRDGCEILGMVMYKI